MVQLENGVARFKAEVFLECFLGINRIRFLDSEISNQIAKPDKLIPGARFLILHCRFAGNNLRALFFKVAVT